MPPRVIRAADVAAAALPLCVASLQEAVDSVGTATFVLSGGSTPLALYRLLAGADLDWSRIHVFWGDERFVPHDDPASNYGVARRAFLDALDIPEGNVHPWPVLETPEASAEAYSDILQSLLGLDFSFTLTLLGLGSDRHTASLFPGTGAVHARGLTVASRPPAASEPRLSLTIEALNRSARIIRRDLARRLTMKFLPDLRFVLDTRFDDDDRINALLSRDEVRRDLAEDEADETDEASDDAPGETPDDAPDETPDQGGR